MESRVSVKHDIREADALSIVCNTTALPKPSGIYNETAVSA
jgi:hypothetical protein